MIFKTLTAAQKVFQQFPNSFFPLWLKYKMFLTTVYKMQSFFTQKSIRKWHIALLNLYNAKKIINLLCMKIAWILIIYNLCFEIVFIFTSILFAFNVLLCTFLYVELFKIIYVFLCVWTPGGVASTVRDLLQDNNNKTHKMKNKVIEWNMLLILMFRRVFKDSGNTFKTTISDKQLLFPNENLECHDNTWETWESCR